MSAFLFAVIYLAGWLAFYAVLWLIVEEAAKSRRPLAAIGKIMNTQNNRATHFPLFIIVEDQKIYGVDPSFSDDKERTQETDVDSLCESCQKAHEEGTLPDDCDDCLSDAFIHYKVEEDTANMRAGVFLTAQAAKDHLEANSYHYDKSAKVYAISAWRNPEMQRVMSFVSSLDTTNEQPSHYRL